MPVIKQLSSFAASQIAAGEVVERPASLVKELIENSLDAGAKNIKLIIERAGSQRISIIDDGCGISKDDLPLALARHATSKIESVADLSSIISFGFRGEALASAAAISRLTLSSKTADSAQAWQISTLDITQDTPIKEVNHPQGTTVDVFDLFFNTPARKLFLKSERTEFCYIEDVVNAFAIIRPDVSFELIHNQKLVKKLPIIGNFAQIEPRLKIIRGSQFIHGISYSEFSFGTAWFGHPSFTRSSADCQWLFVNQRLVKDSGLAQAVKRAYQDVLMVGRYPAFIISLSIDADLIDVNIHPNKQAIKFANKEHVYKAVYYAASSALSKATSVKSQAINPITEKITEEIKLGKNLDMGAINRTCDTNSTTLIAEQTKITNISPNNELQPSSLPKTNFTLNSGSHSDISKAISDPPLGFAVAQVMGNFVISENKDGIVIIDMHAAHERVVYQKLKQQYQKQGIVQQRLIQAIPIKFNSSMLEQIETKSSIIQQFGFTVEIISDSQVLLIALPALLNKDDPAQLFEQFVAELFNQDPSLSISEQVNHILATIGCHSAIRANRNLSLAEMNSLLRQMEQTDYAQACNHGRPTIRKISAKELDAMFNRGK